MRNVLSRVSRANQSVVRAALQQVFVQTDEKSAHTTWQSCHSAHNRHITGPESWN